MAASGPAPERVDLQGARLLYFYVTYRPVGRSMNSNGLGADRDRQEERRAPLRGSRVIELLTEAQSVEKNAGQSAQ